MGEARQRPCYECRPLQPRVKFRADGEGALRKAWADASVFPLQVGVTPNLTVAMIGERCVEWVLAG